MIHTMLEDMVERVGRENREWNIADRDDRGIISNWSRESNSLEWLTSAVEVNSNLERRHYDA